MTAQQLKNSILQMAVQGKLVPQDPNDEPASVLLERIRKEKEKLIKEGKIKKEKNPSFIFRGEDNLPYEKIGNNDPVCIADEVPFEIPESWAWVRLIEVMTLFNGRAYKQTELLNKGTYPILRVGNLFTNNSWYYSDMELDDNKYVSAGDLIYAWSASFGPFIWNGEKCIFHYHIWKIDYSTHLYRDYLYYYLMAATESIRAGSHGLSMQHVTKEGMEKLLIPIPPYYEQVRIVNQIQMIFPYIVKFDDVHNACEQLDKALPEMLKKSILQQAVMGKLVPQDENDEPASVLLERIRAEKEALIKAGKLKKDKHESIIYRRDNSHYEKLDGVERCIDDEIPFEIPASWVWCRVKDIVIKEIKRGKSPQYANGGRNYVFAQKCNVKTGGIDMTLAKFLSDATFEKYPRDEYMLDEDIIINSTGNGTLGRIGIFHDSDRIGVGEVVPDSHVTVIRKSQHISTMYVFYVLKYYQPYLEKQGEGSTNQTELKPTIISDLLFPLPPYNEQQLIAERITQSFTSMTALS